MELTRLVLGLLVARLLPLSLDFLPPRPLAGRFFTMVYAAYAVFPVLPGWKGLAVWIAAALIGPARSDRLGIRATVRSWRNRRPRNRQELLNILQRTALDTLQRAALAARRRFTTPSPNIVMTVGLLALAMAVFYGTDAWQTATHLWQDDRLSVISSGFLLAVFAGNLIVVRVIRPYSNALTKEKDDVDLLHLGTYLGWIERALVFTFIAAGQPEAAALAITVKSLVRLPDIRDDKSFGQYVMMGTMTSLLVAVIAGLVVRIALGLPAL